MGYEGMAAEWYWKEFAKVVEQAQPAFEFPGRKSGSNNMGATDPVNSLLNYGYGVLEAKTRFVDGRGKLASSGLRFFPTSINTPYLRRSRSARFAEESVFDSIGTTGVGVPAFLRTLSR
jgi:hypothetical protein